MCIKKKKRGPDASQNIPLVFFRVTGSKCANITYKSTTHVTGKIICWKSTSFCMITVKATPLRRAMPVKYETWRVDFLLIPPEIAIAAAKNPSGKTCANSPRLVIQPVCELIKKADISFIPSKNTQINRQPTAEQTAL